MSEDELETLRKLVIALSHGGAGQIPGPLNIPIPDPSTVTAKIIYDAKAELRSEFKDLVEAKADMLSVGGVARHEKALIRIDNTDTRLSTFERTLHHEASRINSIFDGKLQGLQLQIDALNASAEAVRQTSDKYSEAMRNSAQEAIAAAFSAAKEVSTSQRIAFEQQINKSEISTTKEIEGLKEQMNAVKDTSAERMTTITGRLDRGEGGLAGVRQSASDRHENTGTIIGVIGGVASILMLLAFVFFNYSSTNRDNRPNTAITLEPTASQSTAIERSRIINDKLDLLMRQLQVTQPPRQ